MLRSSSPLSLLRAGPAASTVVRASYSPSGRAKEHRRARPSSPRADSPPLLVRLLRGHTPLARGLHRGAARLGELAAPSRRMDPCEEEEDPGNATSRRGWASSRLRRGARIRAGKKKTLGMPTSESAAPRAGSSSRPLPGTGAAALLLGADAASTGRSSKTRGLSRAAVASGRELGRRVCGQERRHRPPSAELQVGVSAP